jgi:hypothetical protein
MFLRYLFFIFVFFSCKPVLCQTEREIYKWSYREPTKKEILQQSRLCKIIGLNMIGAGIYLSHSKDDKYSGGPPLMMMGTVLIIEGLTNSRKVKGKKFEYIFN